MRLEPAGYQCCSLWLFLRHWQLRYGSFAEGQGTRHLSQSILVTADCIFTDKMSLRFLATNHYCGNLQKWKEFMSCYRNPKSLCSNQYKKRYRSKNWCYRVNAIYNRAKNNQYSDVNKQQSVFAVRLFVTLKFTSRASCAARQISPWTLVSATSLSWFEPTSLNFVIASTATTNQGRENVGDKNQ